MSKKRKKIIASPTAGHEGRYDLGIMLVDDPFEPGNKISAQVNKRHDVLVHWKSRKQIDDAQFAAGMKLQRIWYSAQVGHCGTCIPTNDRVDSSGASGPNIVKITDSGIKLSEIAIWLGARDYQLIIKVVCEGGALSQFGTTQREQEYTGRRIRDALSSLANYWGAVGRESLPITAYHINS